MQRILVVDDAELNRNLLQHILEDDYTVDLAENGEQALRILEENRQETAALLLDLRMPKMDGFAVIMQMREKGWIQRIPVLIISGECAVETENRCFELGVSDFIRKPFVSSTVKNRLKNTIELFDCRNRLEYNRNPFESIKSRLKTPESIYEKLERKGYPATVENIREQLMDVAGVRVICSFPDDIYRLAEPPPDFERADFPVRRKEEDERGNAVPHHSHGFLGERGT